MRKNVTVNNYYITQAPQNRPRQGERKRNGWAVRLGEENSTRDADDPFFG